MSRKQPKEPALARTQGRPLPALSADEPYPRQTWLFLLLMFVSVGARLWLLIVSQHYLRSDEAVVAMEVLDIMEGGPIPFFLYGQHYGGGHTVDALMAIPWFGIFGASDYWFKLGPAMLSCVYILVVYLCLYQFFNKKYALIAATAFSVFAPFLYFSFHPNGGMAMSLFGWLGLYIFFRSHFAEREDRWSIFLSGAAIGFAYYCFDYALYFLFAVLMLWMLKENIHLWRQWKSLFALMIGFFIGASPLIYYNLTHDFANIRSLLSQVAAPDPAPFLSALRRFAILLYHDLPAFFSVDVDDFPPEISLVSYLSYGLFVISALYIVIRMRSSLFSLMRSFFARITTILPPEQRIVYLLVLTILYMAIYSLASHGVSTPRYLIILSPLIPSIVAWAAYDLGRRHFIPAAIFIALFGAAQIHFMIELAKDRTTVEWRIRTHGEDIKTLAKFLLDNNLTTVATPYEIKWKLMFESRRRIVCAAYLFGFDRDYKYNMEVIDRVNHKGMPLAFVFDKEYKLPQIALRFNPKRAFDVAGFHEFLERSQITYQVSSVGRDYVGYHDFSKHFPLPVPHQFLRTLKERTGQ
jgi:hypothetical protein